MKHHEERRNHELIITFTDHRSSYRTRPCLEKNDMNDITCTLLINVTLTSSSYCSIQLTILLVALHSLLNSPLFLFVEKHMQEELEIIHTLGTKTTVLLLLLEQQ
jgi:hypothetical protein